MLAGTLFFACLPFLTRTTQLFTASVQHFGIIVVWPYLLTLTIAVLKPQAQHRRLFAVALAVVLFLTVLSDLFAGHTDRHRVAGRRFLLLLLRKTRFKAVLLVTGLILGSSVAGYLVMRQIPVFGNYFVMAAKQTSLTGESLDSLVKTFQAMAARYPLQAILISVVIGLSIAVVVAEMRTVFQHQSPWRTTTWPPMPLRF